MKKLLIISLIMLGLCFSGCRLFTFGLDTDTKNLVRDVMAGDNDTDTNESSNESSIESSNDDGSDDTWP